MLCDYLTNMYAVAYLDRQIYDSFTAFRWGGIRFPVEVLLDM